MTVYCYWTHQTGFALMTFALILSSFVHFKSDSEGNNALSNLNGAVIKGRTIKVEKSESRGPKKPSQKLFVGNIKEGTTSEELKELFAKHCEVLEADVIRNYG